MEIDIAKNVIQPVRCIPSRTGCLSFDEEPSEQIVPVASNPSPATREDTISLRMTY